MTIAIGNDHAGTEYKFEILKKLEAAGHTVLNFGTDTNDSMDYPDAIHPTAEAVETGKADIRNYSLWKWKRCSNDRK